MGLRRVICMLVPQTCAHLKFKHDKAMTAMRLRPWPRGCTGAWKHHHTECSTTQSWATRFLGFLFRTSEHSGAACACACASVWARVFPPTRRGAQQKTAKRTNLMFLPYSIGRDIDAKCDSSCSTLNGLCATWAAPATCSFGQGSDDMRYVARLH